MRIFFASVIGFQVPITNFGSGTVIWKGIVFAFALTGKLLVGVLVPNFYHTPKFKKRHLRDVLVTGFSMVGTTEAIR